MAASAPHAVGTPLLVPPQPRCSLRPTRGQADGEGGGEAGLAPPRRAAPRLGPATAGVRSAVPSPAGPGPPPRRHLPRPTPVPQGPAAPLPRARGPARLAGRRSPPLTPTCNCAMRANKGAAGLYSADVTSRPEPRMQAAARPAGGGSSSPPRRGA